MSNRFDAIVIGGGHNGLTAATVLARKGKRVCVLEREAAPGGMAKTVMFGDGAKGPQIAHLLYNLSPAVAKDLKLSIDTRALPTVSLSPDGKHVVMDGNDLRFVDGSVHPEAQDFAALRTRLIRFAAMLGKLADAPPPSLAEGLASLAGLRDLSSLARLGMNVKRLGKADMREFLRIILSNAYDLLLEDLADGPVAGALAADAVRGTWSGPRAPGSVFSLLYRMGQGGGVLLPIGGIGAVIGALQNAATTAGAVLRCDTAVSSVDVVGDKVQGVTLEDGSTLRAPVVLSSLGALQTMQLVGAEHYDVEATHRLRNLRSRGTVAKLNLALKGDLEIPGLSETHKAGRLIIAPSATYVETAFNPVKYGQISENLVVEAVIPSMSDPSLCDGGRQVMSVIVQYVPYMLKGGWTETARKELTKQIIRTLAAYMPNLPALIENADLLTPPDIERLTGAPGGHWHHAELSIDQLLTVRPVNGLSRYAFGVNGYYLCGASAHPGGDVNGSAGRNAARQVLRDGVPQ